MSVPSFTSFPQLEAESSKPQGKSDTRSEKRKHDRSSSSKRRDSERPRDGDTSRERRPEKDRPRKRQKDGRRRDEEKQREPEDTLYPFDESYRLFYSDRKPDLLNVQYGGLHAGDIPKYRMISGGRYAIGLPHGLIVQRVGKGVEVCVKSRNNKLSSITDSRTRSLLALPPNRRLVHSEQSAKYPEVDGFIRLPSRRRKHTTEDTYRAITEPKDGDSTGSESDSSGASSDEDFSDEAGDKHPETSQQAQIRALEQRLAENKGSVQTWLSLLEVTLSSIPITSKNATKARCDITVSVLQRAIDSPTVAKASPILRIKYLKAGEEIWNELQSSEKWEEALTLNDVALWLEWLEWRMRRNKRGLDGVVEDAHRLLSSPSFQGENVDAELARLRVFWRTAVAVQGGGFTERGMAMLQAQLELTFYIPSHLSSSPFQEQLDELEKFWETENPRVLEDGAKGWKHCGRNGSDVIASSQPTEIAVRDLDPYRQWGLQEIAADRLPSFPSREMTETQDLDPYSMVLFSDIRTTLVKISCPRAKRALRLVVLSFLGLPLPGFSQSLSPAGAINWDDRWSMKAFSDPKYLGLVVPSDSERQDLIGESIAGAIIAHEKEYQNSFGPIKHWGYEILSPLDVMVRGDKVRLLLWNSADVGNVNAKLTLRAFSQLRQGESDFDWDALALAFEAALNIKNSLKLSKAFLSVPKESLEYWGAHAQLERINGRLDGARKVYQTVLVASQPKTSQRGLSTLWWNWAEMEWLSGKDEQAINVVLRSVGVESTAGVGILRAKRSLDDSISISVRWQDEVNWIRLRALLELLNDADMKAVLAIFDRHLSSLDEKGIARESLTMASLVFVYNFRVILKNPMPPATLRERAEQALEDYPSNSVILGVFLEGEKGQGVWGKVRSMLGAGDGSMKDVARRMEEVWIAGWEKGRWKGEVERTRSGLAAAIEHERTRASPVIWRLFLEFEIRVGNYQNAKKLLFRAIGECPLVKELYLLAFGPLRSVFDGRELQSLADLMAERGLRLRKGLEEVVGVVQEMQGGLEDNREEDEIEHNARELRRLMPY